MSTINLLAKLLFAGLAAEAPFHLAVTIRKTGKQPFGCGQVIHAELQIDPLSKVFIRVSRGLRDIPTWALFVTLVQSVNWENRSKSSDFEPSTNTHMRLFSTPLTSQFDW